MICKQYSHSRSYAEENKRKNFFLSFPFAIMLNVSIMKLLPNRQAIRRTQTMVKKDEKAISRKLLMDVLEVRIKDDEKEQVEEGGRILKGEEASKYEELNYMRLV